MRARNLLLLVASAAVAAVLTRPAAARDAAAPELLACANDGVEDQMTTYKDFASKNPVRWDAERPFAHAWRAAGKRGAATALRRAAPCALPPPADRRGSWPPACQLL